jgi:tetratricopeptide (TPR) repeat protein
MDAVGQPHPGTPQPAAPARPEPTSRRRRKVLLAALLCALILFVPIPGPQRAVGNLLVDGYRQLIGYPIVGVLIRLGWQAELDDRYAAAERYYKLAATIGPIAPGERTPLVAVSYQRLGNLYRQQQRYVEAVPWYRLAISITISLPDPDPRYLAGLRESLSRMLLNMGDGTHQAMSEAELAVSLREGLGDSQALANTLNLLGNVYLTEREPLLAKTVLQRAVDLYDADPDTDELDLAPVLNNLGIAQESLGEFDQAKTSFQRSLEFRQSGLGPDHPDVAKVLNNLGTLARRQNDNVTAKPLFEQALAIYNRHPQARNPDVADTIGNLGRIAFDDGRYAEAEAFARQALGAREQARPNDPSIFGDLATLGIVLQASGRPAEALPLYERAASLAQRMPGRSPFTYADRLDAEASAYLDLDQPELAEPLLTQALGIAGPAANNLLTVRIRVHTGSVHRRAGRYALAEQMLQESLAWMRAHQPLETRQIADAGLELGLLYVDQARFTEAEAMFNEILAIQTSMFGPEHPQLSTTYADFAQLYAATGRPAEAAENEQHAQSLRRGLAPTS